MTAFSVDIPVTLDPFDFKVNVLFVPLNPEDISLKI